MSTLEQQQEGFKQQGNSFVQQDKFKEAIECYTKALDIEPFNDAAAPIYSNRSMCHLNIGNHLEAFQDAGACCGLRPEWAKGFARRGDAAKALQRYEVALESYDRYLELDPEDSCEVKKDRNLVFKIVQAKKKEAEKHDRELEALRNKISTISNEEKKKEFLREPFRKSYSTKDPESGPDFEMMKICFENGLRLDDTVVGRMINSAFDIDRGSLLFDALMFTTNNSSIYKTVPNNKAKLLNFLLDAAEQQNPRFNYKQLETVLTAFSSHLFVHIHSIQLLVSKGFVLAKNTIFRDDKTMTKSQFLGLVLSIVFFSPEAVKEANSSSQKHLNEAYSSELFQCAKECIDSGADLTIDDQLLPHALAITRSPSILDYLVKSGAPVINDGDNGCLALGYSIKFRLTECARILLNAGALLDVQLLPPGTFPPDHPLFKERYSSFAIGDLFGELLAPPSLELLSLVLEQNRKQGLGYCCTDRNCATSALAVALRSSSPEVVKQLLKFEPALRTTPCTLDSSPSFQCSLVGVSCPFVYGLTSLVGAGKQTTRVQESDVDDWVDLFLEGLIEGTALTESDLKKIAQTIPCFAPTNENIGTVIELSLSGAISEAFPPPQGMTKRNFFDELKNSSFVSSPQFRKHFKTQFVLSLKKNGKLVKK